MDNVEVVAKALFYFHVQGWDKAALEHGGDLLRMTKMRRGGRSFPSRKSSGGSTHDTS